MCVSLVAGLKPAVLMLSCHALNTVLLDQCALCGAACHAMSRTAHASMCCHTGKQKGDQGLYIEPTLFGDVKDDMRIATEEVFGPVLCCMKWHNVDEVRLLGMPHPQLPRRLNETL